MRGLLLVLVALLAVVWPGQGHAEGEAGRSVKIELNKMEQVDGACRAYLLFENDTGQRFDSFRLELILFNADGVIDRRIAVDASPLRSDKSVVKLFDLSGLSCESISRVLLNDVSACAVDGAERNDCIDIIEPSTRTAVSFFK